MNTNTQDAQLSTETGAAPETTTADNLSVAQLAAKFSSGPGETDQAGASPTEETVESSPDPQPPSGQEHDQGEVAEATPPPQPEGEEAEQPAEEPGEQDPRATREFETPKFQKRVDELTAKVKALEEKLNAAAGAKPTAEPSETMVQPEGAVIPMVFRDQRLDEIGRSIRDAEQMIRMADENPDGLEIPGENGGAAISYTSEQLARMKQRAQQDLTKLTIRHELRLDELAQQRRADTRRQVEAAAARYPWIRDPKSPKYQEAMRIVKDNPRLQLEPNAVMLVAGAVEAAMGGRTSAKPSTGRPTPVVPRPGGVPAKPSGKLDALKAELRQAEAVAEQEGTQAALSNVLRLRREVQMLSRQAGT